MFSSDGEWEEALAPPSVATSQAPASRRVTRESSTGQSVVSSGLSDLEGQPNYVKGLAQRATEPDYKQIREKGPFTYEKRAFEPGEHYYEAERPPRPSTAAAAAGTSAPMERRHSMRSSAPGSDRALSSRGGSSRRSSAAMASRSPSRSPPRSSRSPSRSPPRSSAGRAPSERSGHRRASRHSRSPPPESERSYYSSEPEAAREPEEVDVSLWGHDRDPSERGSLHSMSSGLSPRASRPRERGFDVGAATRTLRWAGEKYTQAQMMRREGTAPEAYGVMEDMPTRMAYQQLNVLAGMAGKVQNVIEHNRKIFERRVVAADRAELSRAFKAWRAARYGSIRKQQLLARAAARIMRGKLSRAFYCWKDKFNLVDKYLAMKRKGLAVLRRGRLTRCFGEWRRLVEERAWRHQLSMRDNENDRLARLCRKYENRPVTILANRHLRKCIWGWHNQAWERIRRRKLMDKGLNRLKMRQVSMAWNSWFEAYDAVRTRKQHVRRTIGRLWNNKLSRVWQKWQEVVDGEHRKRLRFARAVRFFANRTLVRAWNSWGAFVEFIKQHKRVMRHWKAQQTSKAWRRWLDFVDERARQRLILTRAVNKMRLKTYSMAWNTWQAYLEDKKWAELYGTKEALLEEVARLRGENERLRRDNERFVRLIDSGEWGRGRVAELVQAGEIMKGERDALMKLIGSLRREYEAVQEAKAAQESELSEMKSRITKFGGPGRNRMLVKGGSSFNGLVRQMKTEMAEAAQAGKVVDPNRMYEVNKLSMDRVQVFPDGELTIEAVNPENATFDRPHPIGKSAVRRGGGVPVTVKTRVPPEFGGGGRSGRPGAPPPHAGPPTGGEGHVMNAIGSRLARTGGMNSSR